MKKIYRHPFLLFLPAILWFAAMCILFFMPGKDVPKIGWLNKIHFDKVVHFGLFFVFLFLMILAIYKLEKSGRFKINLLLVVTIFSIVFGILVEVIQKYFIPGRTFDIFDWVADSSGVIVALLIFRGILRKIRSK